MIKLKGNMLAHKLFILCLIYFSTTITGQYRNVCYTYTYNSLIVSAFELLAEVTFGPVFVLQVTRWY